jgi:hypothetical protein
MKKNTELNTEHQFSAALNKTLAKIQKGNRAFTDPEVKEFCAKRWRNIFINEAIQDPVAMKAATEKPLFGKDNRPPKQKIYDRFLRNDGPAEWMVEYPEARTPVLKNTTLLFCPGLLTGLLPVMAFQEAFPAIEKKYKVKIIQSDSHPMRGCEENVKDIQNAVEKGIGLDANAKIITKGKAPKDIFVICYSKGMPDLLTALIRFPELKNRIRCIFNWAGAPGGSPLADNIYASIKDADTGVLKNLTEVLKVVNPVIKLGDKVRRLDEYHIKNAVEAITTTYRQEFLKNHLKEIDKMNIPIFNLTGSTTVTEVPYFQMQGVMELNKYDANNDMQVTQNGAKLITPMATDLAMLHGHHWDLSYSPFPKNMRFGSAHLEHPFPKEAAATAMIKFAFELGLID